MTLSETLKAADAADNTETARAIAAIFNADRIARKALGQDDVYDVASVQRLGRIVAEYVDAPKAAVDFRPPAARSYAMPARAADAGLAAVSQATAAE